MYERNQLGAILVIGAFFLVIVGSLWHNFYPWSGENQFVGYFAPTNESVYEHMKLIIFPLLIFSLILWALLLRFINNPFTSLLLATLAAMAVVIFWFYLYETLDGKVAMFVLFFVLTAKKENVGVEVVALIAYLVLILLTVVWSYNPPCDCGIWKSPE